MKNSNKTLFHVCSNFTHLYPEGVPGPQINAVVITKLHEDEADDTSFDYWCLGVSPKFEKFEDAEEFAKSKDPHTHLYIKGLYSLDQDIEEFAAELEENYYSKLQNGKKP